MDIIKTISNANRAYISSPHSGNQKNESLEITIKRAFIGIAFNMQYARCSNYRYWDALFG